MRQKEGEGVWTRHSPSSKVENTKTKTTCKSSAKKKKNSKPIVYSEDMVIGHKIVVQKIKREKK